MGVPIAPRNIFPSNIQGLPTWYEVRVSEAGYLGARGGADILVAMNPQTFAQDVASIEPGGYLFYDSTRPMPLASWRDDIVVLGMPLTEICTEEYSDPRQRQLYKNIVYVGALAALLDIELGVIETLIARAVQGQGQADRSQHEALKIGHDDARQRFNCPLGIRLRRSDAVGDRILVEGNYAAALGAVYGGATVCAWYPITPSTSLAEAFERNCARYRVDPATEQEELRHRPGRGRDRRDRHGDRRRLERRARLHRDLRPGHFADAGILRPRLFRRNSGGDVRRAARRALDRHADAHPAVRPHRCAYASHGDTKHVLLIPEDPHEASNSAPRVRSRRAAADAGVRHARSRHRHEPASVPAVRMGRRRKHTTAAR